MNSPFNVRNPNIRAMPNQMNLSTNNSLDDPRKLQALLMQNKLDQEELMSTVQDPTKLMAQMMEQSGPAPTTALGKGIGDIGRDWSAGLVYRKAKKERDKKDKELLAMRKQQIEEYDKI
tara:strand:- start:1400 stop:1756 length:357 start_codon:yes stop_codon:yes gene_type:complete